MKIPFAVRITSIALGCAVLAYAATFLVKARYDATESLYFPMNQDSSNPLGLRASSSSDGSVSSLNGALTSPLIGTKTQTAIGILESHSCADYLVSSLHLAQYYGISQQKAAGVVKQRLRSDTDKNGFLKIDFEDSNKQVAVEVVQQVQAYLGLMSEKLSLNLSRKNRVFIQARLKQAKADLLKKQLVLAKKVGRSPAANPELLQKNLLDIRKEYYDAQGLVEGSEAEIATNQKALTQILARTKDFPSRVVALSSIYKDLGTITEELEKRRMALVDAAAKYKPSDPDLHVVQQDQSNTNHIVNDLMEEMKSDLKAGIAPTLAETKGKLASLKATTKAYGTLLEMLTVEYSQSANASGSIESAERDFKSSEDRVTLLEKELDQSMINEARNPERFQVVDAPYSTGEVAYPKRSTIALIVLVVVLGIQLAFVKPGSQKSATAASGSLPPPEV